MSFNSYQTEQQFTDEQVQQIRSLANGVYNEKKFTTIWYKPQTDDYWLALNPKSEEPDYGVRITKEGEMKRAKKNLIGASSSAEVDHAKYQPFTNEFLPQAVNFNQRLEQLAKEYRDTGDLGKLIGGGTITTADYTAINNVMLDTTVETLVAKDFVILDAFTRKSWDKLVYTFDSKTPYRNTYGLGELDVANSTSISYARGTINLQKAEGHVSVSIWVQMAVRDHNIETDNTELIEQDWDRGFATEGSTTLQLYTNQAAGGLYDALTGEHNTTNPATRFDADTLSIRNAGGMANILCMNSKTFRVLYENSWMKTAGQATPLGANQAYTPVSARVISLSKMPGFTIYIDETLPTGSIIIADKRGALWLDGPRSTRTVESNMGNIVDTLVDRWYGSGIRFSGFGVEETGTAS